MIEKEIVIAGVNITEILNSIIDFVLTILKIEVPEIGEML